jgi:hypothetical protein
MCNYNKDACQHDPYIGDKIKLGTAGLDYDEIVLAGLLPKARLSLGFPQPLERNKKIRPNTKGWFDWVGHDAKLSEYNGSDVS